jgi:N-acetylneuraminate synthase/N,N'-diacetyllegionaminate synthase
MFMSGPKRVQRAGSAVTFGERRIAPDEPVYVVAEAGVNHNGCTETALELVDAAAGAGADAVKFQMFRAARLVAESAATAEYQRTASGETSQQAMLAKLELPVESFARIRRRCVERGVDFMATPFGEEQVSELATLDPAAIKIASADLTNESLLSAAARTGRPMIVSTGASTEVEIRTSVELLSRLGAARRLVLLHCVSAYPAPLHRLNLRAIGSLSEMFDGPVGLSDHTTSKRTGAWAVAAGACVLEKHVTLDPARPGPDHAMSMSPPALASYIAGVRAVERAMGSGTLGMTDAESDVRSAARRSLVAARDVSAGTVLTASMVSVKRPGTGLSPYELPLLLGRRAAVDIQHDTVLTWDMVR